MLRMTPALGEEEAERLYQESLRLGQVPSEPEDKEYPQILGFIQKLLEMTVEITHFGADRKDLFQT